MRKILGCTVPLWLAICILATTAGAVKAQTFKLNTPIVENTILCFDKKAAADIVDLAPDVGHIVGFHMVRGNCFMGRVVVVYSKLVHHKGEWRVYQGRVGRTTVFLPTTWVAEKEVGL